MMRAVDHVEAGVSLGVASRPGRLKYGLVSIACMDDSAHARTELPRIWVTRILYSKIIPNYAATCRNARVKVR